jgi:hypothetical protein
VVEGEIEEAFLRQSIELNLVQLGVVKKFNLMQQSMKPSNNILTKRWDRIVCIIDTDCSDKSNCEKLFNNIGLLKQNGTVFILPQHKNFEDELQYMLGKPLEQVFQLKHRTKADIKRHLSQSVKYEKILTKEHILRYGTRSGDFVNRLEGYGYKIGKRRLIDGKGLLLKGRREV